MDIKQPYTLKDIAKYPMAVLCSFLIGLCIYLMANQDNDCSKCEEEKKQLNDKVWNLSMKILEKNKVIEDQSSAKQKTDSMVRSKTEEPTKQLLNILKK